MQDQYDQLMERIEGWEIAGSKFCCELMVACVAKYELLVSILGICSVMQYGCWSTPKDLLGLKMGGSWSASPAVLRIPTELAPKEAEPSQLVALRAT